MEPMTATLTCVALACLAGQPADAVTKKAGTARLVEARSLVVEASTALESKEFTKAAELYVRAIEAGATSPTAAYNAVCCYAHLGRTDDAFKYLNVAIEKGWTDVERLDEDTDLQPLREDERWKEVASQCAAKRDEFRKSLGSPELYDELMRRMKFDQEARNPVAPDVQAMQRVDPNNTAWTKEVLDKHGWPGFSLVGREGAQAAWLLVQHADVDVGFQRWGLDQLTAAYEKGDATAADVAYLTDRVLVAEGKPQRYGTQFWTVDGELRPRPIEQEAEVDQRRAEMGLEPMAVYAERMRSVYRK